MLNSERNLIARARILVGRLERLSADSSYAHQASGLRGSIIRFLDRYDASGVLPGTDWILNLVEQGEEILVFAARQIPDSE